jgi:hypothetical protein
MQKSKNMYDWQCWNSSEIVKASKPWQQVQEQCDWAKSSVIQVLTKAKLLQHKLEGWVIRAQQTVINKSKLTIKRSLLAYSKYPGEWNKMAATSSQRANDKYT